jgi:sensor histidine kinase YesM
VPLAKELEVARRYVALEKLRLEERLRVVWEVEVEPGSVMVPAFALQTLLDNAVRHGLETRPEGGTIRVGAAARDDVLTLTVADDGEGARPEVVARASGHGLQLLARRLDTLYGDVASVSWTTTPGQGFTATLRFPLGAPPPVDLTAAVTIP